MATAEGDGTSGDAPSEQGRATRARMQAESLGLFLERGYRGTSVRDIAEAIGVTVPALYYHFKSKDGLLAAIVGPFADDGEALMAKLSATRLPRDAFAEVALGGYYDVLAAHLDVFRFVSADLAVRSHDVAGHRLAAQEHLCVLLEKALAEAFERFKEDAAAVTEYLLAEERGRWLSESFELYKGRMHSDN